MAIEFSDFLGMKWYYQALIVVAAAGILLGLAWYQILSPLEAEVFEKYGQLDALQMEIAEATQRQAQLAEIRAEAEVLEVQLEELKSRLPLEQETDDIIREVSEAAREASMRVIRVAPRAAVAQDVYSEWSWDYQVESTYHNMGMFLDAIRQLDRIVNISGINMNAAGDGTATSIQATYAATTFVYREEEPVAAN
jgi:type IV pilus assembly protein PilO